MRLRKWLASHQVTLPLPTSGGSHSCCSCHLVCTSVLLLCTHCVHLLCSPADGEYVTCGSESGPPAIWDFATATATPAPHFALGGAPVYCVAWNNCFHAVAVCSFSPYAPIRVLCFDPQQPQVALNPPQQQGAAAAAERKQRQAQVGPCYVSNVVADCTTCKMCWLLHWTFCQEA